MAAHHLLQPYAQPYLFPTFQFCVSEAYKVYDVPSAELIQPLWDGVFLFCPSAVQLPSHVQPCDPMYCCMPGFPVHHNSRSLLRLMSVESVSNPNIISSSVVPFSSCLQSFPASGSFLMSQLFKSSGQSIGASASASVFPVNIQG